MKILAFAEQRDGKLKKVAFEVAYAARQIAGQLGAETVGLLIGNGVADTAAELGMPKVYVVEDDRLGHYSSTAYARIVADASNSLSAEIILMPASAMGKDLAPRVAAKLHAGLASDCIALKVEGGEILATRPIYAGKAVIDLKISSPKKVFTLRPNVFSPGEQAGTPAAVEKFEIDVDGLDFSSKVKSISIAKAGRPDLTEANMIVSGGRGLGGPENFGMIEELADALDAAVGASRAVVDAGWRPHEDQVGQTGKTVSPSLYVAVAISGAIQHLAGMSSSKHIVAINKDKDAPIFQIADYGIVGDAFEVVPELTKQVKKALGKD